MNLSIYQSIHSPSNKDICKVPGALPGTWHETIFLPSKDSWSKLDMRQIDRSLQCILMSAMPKVKPGYNERIEESNPTDPWRSPVERKGLIDIELNLYSVTRLCK